MDLLLVALAVLVASGFLALAAGRFARLATALGAGGAVIGCALGFIPAFGAIVHGSSEKLTLPWNVPSGSFSIALDPLSAWFILPIVGLCGLAAIYGAQYLSAHGGHAPLGRAWFFYNVLAASMVMVVLARNGVLFLVAWELMSLASYFLVTLEDDDEAACEAGRTYLVATHLGTAFLLAFFLALGARSGSLDFEAIAAAGAPQSWLASLLFVLAVVGFGTKAGFMPLHVWLPEAHPAAPSHVSAVMSGVMVKTGIYGIVRALTMLSGGPAWWGWLLIGVGVLSGIWGILFALAQHDLKRLLAYSTVENVGIIALGLGIGLVGSASGDALMAALGIAGALLQVMNHAVVKGLLFLGAGAIVQATGTRDIDLLGGLAKRMPALACAFVIGAVAIVGLPPLSGFAGEFLIYLGALRGQAAASPSFSVPSLLAIAALALIGGLAAVCFSKVVGVALLGEPRTPQAAAAHSPGVLMVAPIVVLAAASLLIGLSAPLIVGALVPIAATVSPAVPSIAALVDGATGPMSMVILASTLLLGAAAGLAILRRFLLAGRPVDQVVTWDCGYARPTARMQYTSSSYAQPATAFFGPLLRPRRITAPPAGLFPGAASFSSETPDLCTEVVYRPALVAVSASAGRLRWLQHGRIHIYVMYIGITLLVLLLWYLGAVLGS
jgi:formate hydrogenlyase subunit 3/multisubunit Na+/H+ antiporter MnhD subunit